jgi:predicted  nucleic acid-binding Zn-ribbon protein
VIKKNKDYFIAQALNKHGDKYNYQESDYISSHIKIKIICKKHGEFWQTPHNHLKGQNCPQCGKEIKFNKLSLTEQEVDSRLKKIKRLSPYKNSSFKMNWLCLDCNHQWKTSFNSINAGHGCPKCNNSKLSNQHIDAALTDRKIKRIGNYINNYSLIDWFCEKCKNIWSAAAADILRKDRPTGCPKCSKQKNEKLVAWFLDHHKIQYHKIKLEINGKKIFPDFYISDLNLIIEYNGIQHYQPISFGKCANNDPIVIDNFVKQQQRDEYLRIYCKNNGIKLLEINGIEYKGLKLLDFLKKYFKTEDKK